MGLLPMVEREVKGFTLKVGFNRSRSNPTHNETYGYGVLRKSVDRRTIDWDSPPTKG